MIQSRGKEIEQAVTGITLADGECRKQVSSSQSSPTSTLHIMLGGDACASDCIRVLGMHDPTCREARLLRSMPHVPAPRAFLPISCLTAFPIRYFFFGPPNGVPINAGAPRNFVLKNRSSFASSC